MRTWMALPGHWYFRGHNTQSQGRLSILSDSNYGVVLRSGIRHRVRMRGTHQCGNQQMDDQVRASELDAVAQLVGAGARSTGRPLSGRIWYSDSTCSRLMTRRSAVPSGWHRDNSIYFLASIPRWLWPLLSVGLGCSAQAFGAGSRLKAERRREFC